MTTTWAESEEWEKSRAEDPEEEQDHPTRNESSPGSYHCKAALRDHESNMKLFMYRKSYKYLSSISGTLPYDEDSLILLPDFWRCFYNRTHGMNRMIGESYVRDHSSPSPSFSTWMNYSLKEILDGRNVLASLNAEVHCWGNDTAKMLRLIASSHHSLMCKIKSLLPIVFYFNLCTLVLNYRYNPKRPDISVDLPNIVEKLDDDLHIVKFNSYIYVYVYLEGVRVVTPRHDRILQKDIFLTLCDKMNERLNVIVGATLITHLAASREPCDAHGKDGDLELIKDVSTILNWGDDLLYRFRNRAYELIGKYEAYCVSAILMSDDPNIWDNKEFQSNLLKDDLDNQPDLYPHATALCGILEAMTISNISEIHGLWRIWGHPIIDLHGGLKKMETTCLKQHNIDNKETAIGARTFKLLFATNYFKKHRHYPLCNVSPPSMSSLYLEHMSELDKAVMEDGVPHQLSGSYIKEMIEKNTPINERSVRYYHEDWDHVVFLQNFQIPQSINLATMIKDKAISQTRSELVESVSQRNSVFDPLKRRGILKWLSVQTYRLKDYLRSVDANGLPDNDKIIGLYPKERELKTKARFFSLMSYNFRMYVTATEEILGKYLLPYFPMITMSDTLLNMIIRLYNMTTCIGKGSNKVVYSMNIDFSKWNQNMREKTNAGVFLNIDRIIGFRNLISRTHALFRTSFLYLCSGEYIPAVIRGMLMVERPYSRIGDESGKEGLRQKGWTLTTVCDIVSLAFMHGVKIELIGGGDNQVLTVEIRSSGRNLDLTEEEQMNKIRNKMNRFRNALAKKMEKRGLPLKLEETWISHRLLMYNKIMYLDGVPLPGRLKVISRLFSNSNEGICTLGNITSTLGTGYQSLSSKDYTPLLSWIISRVITMICIGQYYMFNPVCGTRRLDKQILLSKSRLRDGLTPYGDDLIAARGSIGHKIENATSDHTLSLSEVFYVCLYYHKILGGPGIGSPLAYIMKGFPDNLSESLTFNYSVLNKSDGSTLFSILDNLTSVEKASIQHWEHLLEDPVSINHNAPTHGIAALREQAERVLKVAEIKNVSFKRLINIGSTDYLRKLSGELCRPRQLEPRLLHDIVGATIPGYVNTVLSKVDQSSTLNKLATDHDVITSVYTSEILYYMYLAKKTKIKTGHTRSPCATRDAQMLRNTTWGKDIIGVTTPHPAAFLEVKEHHSSDMSCDQNFISVLVSRDVPVWKIQRGPFRPYFGSYTAEKFKTSVLASAYGDEDILKRALKIQKLLGWRYHENSPMYGLIQGILRCVTDSDPNKFKPRKEEITGDVEHRYHDMATKHGGIPTNLVKLYTHTSCNTSTFSDHSKGAANESLHFQAAMIYSSMMSIISCRDKASSIKLLHFHESCRSCISPVRSPSDLDIDIRDVNLVACPTNELMYISEKDIPIHFHNCVEFHKAEEKKKRIEERRKGPADMVEFVDPTERGSWLVLLIASLYKDSGKMKQSSIKLALDSLSLDEIMIMIRELKNLHMINKRVPTNLYQLADVEDLLDDISSLIGPLMQTKTLFLHAQSIGILHPADSDGYSSFIYDMLCNCVELETGQIKSAACKYQDPEYPHCRCIIMCSNNPTSKTCLPCVEAIHSTINGGSTMRDCGIHGALSDEVRYHLYSLDKLSRYKGHPISREKEEPEGNKRKRQLGLFHSIKIARTSESERGKRSKRRAFLFCHSPTPHGLIDYLSQDWTKRPISIKGEDSSDKVLNRVDYHRWEECKDILHSVEGEVISLCQMLIGIIFDYMANSRKTSTHERMRLSLELKCTPSAIMTYTKAFSMLDDVLSLLNFPMIEIRFMVPEVISLESTDVSIISEMASFYTRCRQIRKKVNIYDLGDGAYDIMTRMDQDDIVVLQSSYLAGIIKRDVYLYTRSTHVYSLMGEIQSRASSCISWALIQPIRTVTDPYPILVKGTSSPGEAHQLSDMLLSTALENDGPSTDRRICNAISSCFVSSVRSSLLYDVYKTEAGTPAGITSKSLYENCIFKLSSGLKRFALESKQDEMLPWRCVLIVRLILAVRILTDNNELEAVKYYSKYHSFSYKRGTYKMILLHRKRLTKRDVGPLINWTPDSLGSKLHDTVRELSGWLSITWKSDHERCHTISL